jgi:hypothetical protein
MRRVMAFITGLAALAGTAVVLAGTAGGAGPHTHWHRLRQPAGTVIR